MAVNISPSIFEELANFIVSEPSLEAVAGYQVSLEVQAYIDDLLEKKRESGLSPEERLELEKILAVSHMMTLAKIKANLKLAGKQ
jgi:hypothetical protein